MELLSTLFQVPLTTESKGSKAYYEQVLGRIAETLLLGYDICIKDKSHHQQPFKHDIHRYGILEAEVYFKTLPEYHHDDPFTHAHPLQYQNGVWFFHHVGHSKGYRGGSRKGMDVTLIGTTPRNNKSGGCGGILIRAVQCHRTGKVIEGPSLWVDLILKTLGHTSIKDMISCCFPQQESQSSWDSTCGLYLAPKLQQQQQQQSLYASYRIGLGLKNKTPSLEKRLGYVCRAYRFVVHRELLKKGKAWDILTQLHHQHMTNTKSSSKKTSKFVESCQVEYWQGRKDAATVIRTCVQGSKDIVQGSSAWKLRVMSAILWWEEQIISGNQVDLGL
ncbi:uncharacterized protein BX664DRAFT_337266 [Halteromyces radiatus]|uniref:uncharacterized protein n=1 Tax=Halteromyces radiatus TaxID=101107 RepID=UPI002220352D|nr:uncharacterized protein BX664DRAFT_337266 [Halteromyces radiatus]KAI8084564.1 hypothetical protein BX664DRAFT_337266 [Halteromyces radiatus]